MKLKKLFVLFLVLALVAGLLPALTPPAAASGTPHDAQPGEPAGDEDSYAVPRDGTAATAEPEEPCAVIWDGTAQPDAGTGTTAGFGFAEAEGELTVDFGLAEAQNPLAWDAVEPEITLVPAGEPDPVWVEIAALEAARLGSDPLREDYAALAPEVAALVETLPSYAEGSISYSEDGFFWRMERGAYGYFPEERVWNSPSDQTAAGSDGTIAVYDFSGGAGREEHDQSEHRGI